MNDATRKALRVLVIDDDDGIRTLMTAILRRRGATVECVPDGDAALCTLRKNRYDAIVLDLMLPRTNGFEVVRHLKNLTPELLSRTIVVTAVSNAVLRDFEDGRLVRRILRKPFDIDEFTRAVTECSEAAGLPSVVLPIEAAAH